MASAGPHADREPRRGGKTKPGKGGSARKARPRWWRITRALLALGILLFVLAAAGLAGIFIYYGSDPNLPTLRALSDYHPKQVVRIVDRHGTVVGEIGEKRTVVPFEAIPKVLIQAMISAEDADFYKHGGIDYRGMLRAFIENVVRRRTAQGGSTITQQVVKTFLLSPERTLRRKVQEIILARRLTDKLSKDEVLTLYLNQINFGHGRYGCEEAARFYFAKSVRDIDTAEAALLAGLPQGPERLSPRKHPDAAKNRQRYVLGQMAQNGYITREMAEKLGAQPIRLAKEGGVSGGGAPEVMDYVGHVLSDRGGAKLFENGGKVETTVDAKLQAMAREALERGLEEVDARQGYRGRSAHLQGKALEKHRAQLTAWREDRQRAHQSIGIVEGIVERVEPDAQDPAAGKLVVDIGGLMGAVDLSREPRYEKGTKPLPTRFAPGDLVRVRLAPERGQGGELVSLAMESGPQAAMVVMDPQTHEVLALVGGYGYHAGGFDRTRDARRQPGSSFKPIVYAAALDTGKYTAASIVNDSALPFKTANGVWKPQNHETDDYKGPVRLRYALAESINTVAIQVLNDIEIPAALDMASKVGLVLKPFLDGFVFTSPRDDVKPVDPAAAGRKIGLSLALGAVDVAPIDMANAYATFASGGKRGDWVIVRNVLGQALPRKPLEQTVRPEVAYVITSMMKSVVQEGTARAAAGRLRRPAAGKTGTSDASRDAWFIGYTPDLLAAVWVGFDDGKPLGRGEAGARSALPIWLGLMSRAVSGRPVRDFPQPPGVVVARIDKTTGLLAAAGADGLDEVFVDGTAPTDSAPVAGQEPSADKLLLEQ